MLCRHISFLPVDRRFLEIGSNLFFPLDFLLKILHQKSARGYSREQILAQGILPPWAGGRPPGREDGLECFPQELKPQRYIVNTIEKVYVGFTLASVGIPFRLQGTLWSVALSMAFKVLLGWGMFSLANMNSGSNQASWWERKWLCSQNYLSPLYPPLSQPVHSDTSGALSSMLDPLPG